MNQQQHQAPAAAPVQSMTDQYFIPAIAGLFVAIIIVGVVVLVMIQKKTINKHSKQNLFFPFFSQLKCIREKMWAEWALDDIHIAIVERLKSVFAFFRSFSLSVPEPQQTLLFNAFSKLRTN